MRQRGPDHAGVYEKRFDDGTSLALLHRRLAIVDLDPRSNQPLRRGGHVIAFNGELYDYREIRERLAAEGTTLTTEGDTEVLLAWLAQHGPGALDACEGMWAFAFFDEEARRLTLSRDRFGEKPLYYVQTRQGIYFASETRALSALMGEALDVDEAQLQRFLVQGYKSLYKQEQTFYRNVREVPPGTTLETGRDGRPKLRRYYVPRFAPDEAMSYEDAVRGVRDHLRESVRLRLRADVPIAFLLSGGVDSNGLVGVAKRELGADVHAFTLVSEDWRYDEREAVERVVRESALKHTMVASNRNHRVVRESALKHTMVPIRRDGFREGLESLVAYHDAPLLTITSYVQWLLMEQVAARGFRVVVTGVGADELLTGYYDHHNLFLGEMLGSPEYAPALDAWERHVRPVVRNPHLQNPHLYVEDPAFRDHVYLNRDRFAQCLRRDWYEGFREERYADSLLRNRMMNELRHESVPVILHEDDLNAMYYSLENRAPYLSRSLCDFCQRIPTRHLIRQGRAKAPLRDALAGWVPDTILSNRTKVGFNAPIGSLLNLRDARERQWLLDDGPIFELVRKEAIESMLTESEVPNSVSKFLFSVACCKVFLEQRSTRKAETTSWEAQSPGKRSTTSGSTSSSTCVAIV